MHAMSVTQLELKILDDFPAWSIYIIALIVAAAFLISLAILIRSSRAKAHNAHASRRSPRFSGLSLLFLIVTSLALWFLGTSMFSSFHAMAIGPKRIELVYFWPRARETIQRSDVIEVKIVRAYRTCGHMVVVTREDTFRSINFKKCNVAQEILEQLSDRATIERK